jgi:16S rRNA (adenine1518-N6/adenine1519-N6)-dimethyltransferase
MMRTNLDTEIAGAGSAESGDTTIYGPSILERLRRHGLSPRKSLGQNFLIEPAIADRIVAAATLTQNDTVLEIGPGPGMLTERLAAHARHVVAAEIDRDMVALLHAELGSLPNLTIVRADILKSDPGTLAAEAGSSKYKVVANLPYYITSPVLRHLLEAAQPPPLAVLMVQQEVAERICARPGNMSILAVSVQFYARPRLLFSVPAEAFHPRPNVKSAIIHLDVLPTPAIEDVETEHFFDVVRAGFGQKRKQLANSLSVGLTLPKQEVAELLRAVDIDPTRRAETLSLEEWGNVARRLA